MNFSYTETIILSIYVIAYFSAFLAVLKRFWASKELRKKSLSPLFIFNMILFSAGLAISFWYDYSPNISQFITIYGLLAIGVYVATIEVPGFLMLDSYDEKSVVLLQDIKDSLIKSRYHFSEGIQKIHSMLDNNKQRLEELHAYDQLKYYEDSSSEMNQANTSVFDLLLMSTNQWIKDCDEQSKHPFPKLVDILSLAGLSFLIAQFLK